MTMTPISTGRGRDLEPARIWFFRWASLAPMAFYALGAWLLAASADPAAGWSEGQLGGLLLWLLALAGLGAHAATSAFRIALEPKRADEREHLAGLRAALFGYRALLAGTVLGAIYLAFARDFGLWAPRDGESWMGVGFGAVVFGLMLPAAHVAWTARSTAD